MIIPNKKVKKSYSSPNYVPRAWKPVRPGDVADTGNPKAAGFGDQGPDQGYILKFTEKVKLCLKEGESKENVLAGCSWLALRRASLLGRAPVLQDLEHSLQLFGYLYENPPVDLVSFRQELVEGAEFRIQAVELVENDVLLMSPLELTSLQRSSWQKVFNLK